MACEAPMTAYRATHRGGPVTFKRPQQHTYEELQLPCGTCFLCREEQARQQAVRIIHEAQMHERSAFLNLTYEDRHLPANNSLNYDHLVDFWKRVRKHLWKKQRIRLRYYAVGEYGDISMRPHYHAALFGHDFTDDQIEVRPGPNRLWTSPLLRQLWGWGNVAVGTLNFQTARYTASYMMKKLRAKQKYVRIDEDTGELIELAQPRAFMSRNLGKSWWEKYHHQVIAHDHVIINGRRQKPPKAYDRWLKARSEIAAEMIKDQRLRHAKEQTEEQTRARARNARAHAKSKSKML